MEEIGTIKDLVYAVMLVLSVGSVYWKNEIDKVKIKARIQSLEHENKGQGDTLQKLMEGVEEVKSMLEQHIAYHRGKESKD